MDEEAKEKDEKDEPFVMETRKGLVLCNMQLKGLIRELLHIRKRE